MAKQLVNPLERHVEKAVVGLAAILLLGVIARYLVTTPNQIELGGETVTPRTIDAKVAQKAREALIVIRNARPTVEQPEPLVAEFVSWLEPLKPGKLAAGPAIGPDVPLIDPPITRVGQASLVQVVRPAKPGVTYGRSTLIVSTNAGDRHRPRNWATVSAVFDVKTQRDLQRHAYGAARSEIIIGPAQLQKRTQRPDGTWSDDDWEFADSWPTGPDLGVPTIVVVDGSDGPAVSADDHKALTQFHTKVKRKAFRRDVLRPMFAPTANGTNWSFPVITSYRDVMNQDDELLNPTDPPSKNPDDLYGLSGQTSRRAVTRDLTPQEEIAEWLAEAERLIESSKKNLVINEAILAQNLAVDVILSSAATARDKAEARDLQTRAQQAENDITRDIKRGRTAFELRQKSEGRDVKREPLPIQQVWTHDANEGSLLSGATYQHRVRFQLFNQFAGEPRKFDNPDHAEQVYLAGEWSEPSDPIRFEATSLYFVTYDERSKERIGVEFFRWFEGVWVKSRREKFGVGDSLRTKQRTQAPSPTDPTKADNALVDFYEELTVVDIDFDRPLRERTGGPRAPGASFSRTKLGCAVVFMDPQGNLHERFVALDKADPRRREAAGKVWTPPRRTP